MFDDLKAKRRNKRDEKLLAEHKARDADLGTPTKATLTERIRHAAQEGYWKTALGALEQGADPLARVKRNSGPAFEDESDCPLTFLAIKQDNPQALRELLRHGADRLATGVYRRGKTGLQRKVSTLNYAAHNGSAGTMAALLEAGPVDGLQAQMNVALLVTAADQDKEDMMLALLNHGANNYEEAIYAAEKANNRTGIITLRIRDGQIRSHISYVSEGPGLARQKEALEAIFSKATAEDRLKLLAHLHEKFTADFDTGAKIPEAVPAARQKHVLSM